MPRTSHLVLAVREEAALLCTGLLWLLVRVETLLRFVAFLATCLSDSLMLNVMQQEVLESDCRHVVEGMAEIYRSLLGKLARKDGSVCIRKGRQMSLTSTLTEESDFVKENVLRLTTRCL
jgi:hypothetical protein